MATDLVWQTRKKLGHSGGRASLRGHKRVTSNTQIWCSPTSLTNNRSSSSTAVLGDGRLSLEREPNSNVVSQTAEFQKNLAGVLLKSGICIYVVLDHLISSLHRRQSAAARHQQARQRLPAPHVHPRRSCRAVDREVRHRTARPMGARVGLASAAQQGDRRGRQQAGAHRLGGVVERKRVPCRSRRCRVEFPPSLLRRGKTKEQSNGVPENLTTLLVTIDRSRYKDRHARIIIVARRKNSN
jgi:hypothetical protein